MFVAPAQVTVVLLTGAAGVHAAFAYPVKVTVVTGTANTASARANFFRLKRFIASATQLGLARDKSLARINPGSPFMTQSSRCKMLMCGDG